MRSRGQSPLLPFTHDGQKFPVKARHGRTSGATKILLGTATLICFLYGTYSLFGGSGSGHQISSRADGSGRGLTAHEEVAQLQGKNAPVLDAKAVDENAQLQTQGGGHGADKSPELNSNGLSADHAARATDSVQQASNLGSRVEPNGLYTMAVDDIDGQRVELSKYAGNVSLVVNVASECGYTDSNYRGLQALYEKYHASGFEILAFPCNSFGQQEPGSTTAIKDFARARYGVTFPLFQKVEVLGSEAHPVFNFLTSSGGKSMAALWQPKWNFAKYLVDRHGNPVKHYDSAFDAEALERDIAAQLLQAA